jgi:hypothetical protein
MLPLARDKVVQTQGEREEVVDEKM